jgi:hypothetical protein
MTVGQASSLSLNSEEWRQARCLSYRVSNSVQVG